ncbi:MAG: hypothetical protein LBO09_00985 [Candidatus Peribacteria bacterium]|jgi:hypothetical protein|nr:hypothetical protein [Candidatus Peribacteria bacterium]
MSDFSFTIREKFSHIDFFEHTEQDSVLHLSEGANLTYAMFLKNAKITLKVLAESPHVKGQIFVFVAGGQTSLQVETNLQSSHTSVQVHLIAIQGEEDEVQMQGTIDIAS